jgi:hypothetical protein
MMQMPLKFMLATGALVMGTLCIGCATQATAQPARLAKTDAATMTALRTALASALGRTRIELGPEDLANATVVSVLPLPLGPYDTRSLEVPALFDITMERGTCMLVARSDGKTYPLTGVSCKVAKPH